MRCTEVVCGVSVCVVRVALRYVGMHAPCFRGRGYSRKPPACRPGRPVARTPAAFSTAVRFMCKRRSHVACRKARQRSVR